MGIKIISKAKRRRIIIALVSLTITVKINNGTSNLYRQNYKISAENKSIFLLVVHMQNMQFKKIHFFQRPTSVQLQKRKLIGQRTKIQFGVDVAINMVENEKTKNKKK